MTRRPDGTATCQPLLTFDPFRSLYPRAAPGTHDPVRYAARRREHWRFVRAMARRQSPEATGADDRRVAAIVARALVRCDFVPERQGEG